MGSSIQDRNEVVGKPRIIAAVYILENTMPDSIMDKLF